VEQIQAGFAELQAAISTVKAEFSTVKAEVSSVKAEVKAEVGKLRAEIRVKNAVVSPSSALPSDTEYYNLRVEGVFVEDFEVVPDGQLCLSQKDIESSFKDEYELTEFLTPTLQKLCSHGVQNITLVSSEDWAWLPGVENDRKPDFHLNHCAFTVDQNSVPSLCLGGVVKQYIDQVIFLFEAKLCKNASGPYPLSNGDKAPMLNYLTCLADAGAIRSRGLTFNQEAWEYCECTGAVVQRIVRGKWTDAGSFEFLSDRIGEARAELPPLSRAIVDLCALFSVEATETHSFIGYGAEGFVFRVMRGMKLMALKISKEKFAVCKEFENLVGAYSVLPDFVVEPGKYEEIGGYGGFTMLEIGRSVPLFDKDAAVECLRALLHLHQISFIHGDPRINNFVFSKRKYKMIDFGRSQLINSASIKKMLIQRDLDTFCRSFHCSLSIDCMRAYSTEVCEERSKYILGSLILNI
jgi:hypothetical protein